ncbi:hypothetical protein MHO82_22315 [Vibrio sp. Of7-15]|uniref:hypothetical protein n=1 Tax=Vibrio sp. Of7-15 TaxID=2724879 RepID=UPI001EF2A2B3|nr:hypothetical protein [Vibrio sp. Of7-15]MCG7499603.1 hypothetical protein [Vibrio sp. Of7-15]
MKKLLMALLLASTSASATDYINFSAELTSIEISNDVQDKYDVKIGAKNIKFLHSNPWGIGFTSEVKEDMLGSCEDNIHLNKSSSKNYHTILSSLMSAQVHKNKLLFTLSKEHENCEIKNLEIVTK